MEHRHGSLLEGGWNVGGGCQKGRKTVGFPELCGTKADRVLFSHSRQRSVGIGGYMPSALRMEHPGASYHGMDGGPLGIWSSRPFVPYATWVIS